MASTPAWDSDTAAREAARRRAPIGSPLSDSDLRRNQELASESTKAAADAIGLLGERRPILTGLLERGCPSAMRVVASTAAVVVRKQVAMADGVDAAISFVAVPTGKRLVIEQVTAVVSVSPGQPVIFNVLTTVNNNQALHSLIATPQGTFSNGLAVVTVSQQVRLYADAGTNAVRLAVVRGAAVGSASATVSLSGYLVDL